MDLERFEMTSPRKGTETGFIEFAYFVALGGGFEMTSPRKGTETSLFTVYLLPPHITSMFEMTSPRKGTETLQMKNISWP